MGRHGGERFPENKQKGLYFHSPSFYRPIADD